VKSLSVFDDLSPSSGGGVQDVPLPIRVTSLPNPLHPFIVLSSVPGGAAQAGVAGIKGGQFRYRPVSLLAVRVINSRIASDGDFPL
jgi:hypothetical protein